MPNWCQNTILFNGPTEELSKLIETVEGPNTSLSLRKIIYTPEELVTSSAPNRNENDKARFLTLYGAADWYDFQVKNWGTKWDVQAQIIYDSKESAVGYHTYTEKEVRTVKMEFDSAWSPPQLAILMLAKQFPKTNIYHSYDESGSDYSGYDMYSNGECVKSEEFKSYSNVRMYIEPDTDIFDYFPES